MVDLTYDNATHELKCSHAIGRNRKVYWMRCHALKKMPGDRFKVLVFGDRDWAGNNEKCRERYVDTHRLREITKHGN